MSLDLAALRAALARHGMVARVVVAEAQGSAPREAGAAMIVWDSGQQGTIGGGALEWEAARQARAVLAGEACEGLQRMPLGPGLGQCCGGAVTLLTEVIDGARLAEIEAAGTVWARPVSGWPVLGGPVAGGTVSEGGVLRDEAAPLAVERIRARARRGTERPEAQLVEGWMVEPLRTAAHDLWLHGAGHVGRALTGVLAPLPDWRITWVDTGAERFPAAMPEGVDMLVAAEPARAVAHAPGDAHHLILTYSHALDLALCDAVLRRGFASAGLIGSATKWARFRRRLAAMGHAPGQIARIACPIGDPAMGKHPQAIAIGTAAALMRTVGTAAPADDGLLPDAQAEGGA
ncbi:xanthine dehydrogenase accessory protein XdhC [Rhodovulum sp. 12E13]|uniref:xanthine dehydrogenase accessory protein XdhC n=1 Tax=Rhodovulum sp. 12E13 TaxID=2203891 RepID=UPI000E15122C|nr:xanthine dehydrogenase accessory protein XdhC [Rhodovulum sp. 12E13]RDC72818.1 xanthine dehydrogenase accessory protein XdhC [Rhodovulum sp. 12E13]